MTYIELSLTKTAEKTTQKKFFDILAKRKKKKDSYISDYTETNDNI